MRLFKLLKQKKIVKKARLLELLLIIESKFDWIK